MGDVISGKAKAEDAYLKAIEGLAAVFGKAKPDEKNKGT